MKRLLWILLILSISLNIGLLVRLSTDQPAERWSQDRHRGAGRGPGDGPRGQGPGDMPDDPRRFEGLGLTGEQLDRLAELRAGNPMEMGVRREEMRELFGTLHGLMKAETIDRAAVNAARQRLGAVRAEVDSLVSEHLIAELEVLSVEQRETYLQRMPWDRFRKGMGRRSRD